MNVKRELATIQTNLQSPNTATTNTVNGKIADLKAVSANLVSGDADLVAANIKKDIVILGVTGTFTTDAVNPIVAADVLDSKVAFVNGAKVLGTMPDSSTNITPTGSPLWIPLGYHDGAHVVTGDIALVTGNIKAGVTIYGVAGKTEVIDTTDAVDPAAVGDVMAGKVFFVNGVKYVGTKV